MQSKFTEGQAFITFAQAADMTRAAGLNKGQGIHPSTIRRWTERGFAKGGFPIKSHPNLPGQIDMNQWAMFVGGAPAAEIETATVQREIQRRNAFMEGVTK